MKYVEDYRVARVLGEKWDQYLQNVLVSITRTIEILMDW